MKARTTSMALSIVMAAAGAVLAFGESSSRAASAAIVENTMGASALDTWDASRMGAMDAGVNSTAYDASALGTYDAKGPTVSYGAGK